MVSINFMAICYRHSKRLFAGTNQGTKDMQDFVSKQCRTQYIRTGQWPFQDLQEIWHAQVFEICQPASQPLKRTNRWRSDLNIEAKCRLIAAFQFTPISPLPNLPSLPSPVTRFNLPRGPTSLWLFCGQESSLPIDPMDGCKEL